MVTNVSGDARWIVAVRLGLGLTQGVLLYLLYSAGDARVWPATNPMLFVPLGLVAVFVPLLVSQGLSIIRLRTLSLWAGAATAMIALLGFYDRYRVWLPDLQQPIENGSGIITANMPNPPLILFTAAALFITQALIAAGDAERNWTAHYTRYFETAWKQGVQLALSLAFTGAFWLTLLLGAQLFKLIGLTFLDEMIGKAWFAIPATAITLALAVHITDIRVGIVEGIRAIALALLSWLLPLLAVMAGGFLIALVFTGLDPLWKTRNAAAILLLTSAALVILANAAFQDGDPARAVPKAMRLAGYVAGFILLPFVIIAGYAISLRVGQYGWTADRITATAITVVALCYAGGYLAASIAALRKGHWRLIIERTNIAAAFLAVFVIVCLFSPIANPTRIAVNSQVSMLESGAIVPARFDFHWLRFDGGRFGHDALVRLSTAQNATIAKMAADTLKTTQRYVARVQTLPAEDVRKQLKVYPSGYQLPATFLAQLWRVPENAELPACLRSSDTSCEVFPAELTGDTRDELILVWHYRPDTSNTSDDYWNGTIVGSDANGEWSILGTLQGPRCKAALTALRAGQYHPVAPTASPLMSLDAAETRLNVAPIREPQTCPAN